MLVVAMLCASAARAGSNDKPPPEAYLDPIDQQMARTGKGMPCTRETSEGMRAVPTEQCVKMLPARRYRGLWLDAFEGSRFCAEPARECTPDAPGDRIWLDVRDDKGRRGGLHVVEFIGRRTLYKGAYGHLGGSDHEMIVDKMLFIERDKEVAAAAE